MINDDITNTYNKKAGVKVREATFGIIGRYDRQLGSEVAGFVSYAVWKHREPAGGSCYKVCSSYCLKITQSAK